MIEARVFKGEDEKIVHSVSDYIIATVHSPFLQFAVHGSEIGKKRW